ncbi:hypothetical protein HZ994_13740 [Akkermansiaceae bacterium]|nr:hypothetical protein HZ994_13740 [Akkermansiaceae bacterium]
MPEDDQPSIEEPITEIIRSKKNPVQAQAISNLGQLYYPLMDFNAEYGSFPSDETAALVREKHPSKTNLSGTSSNALFRQLFAAQLSDSEQIFYAKVDGARKPDGDISPGHLLEKGECAFAYIANISRDDHPALPIAFAPLIPGTKKFDPKPFDRKAVVLRLDRSVTVLNINSKGEALIGGGLHLLDPENGLWKGKIPDIRYPE